MNKNKLIFWGLVALAYFATRLINLTIIPIFTDEAIYSYWAQVALHDPANRFISLEDGKQPLFIWLAAVLQQLISDPLAASRLVSVFSGFAATIGIYLLAKNLFSERVARLSSLLYIILPFGLLYDRMALFDSLLTMFGIYAVLFTIKLAKEPRLDTSILTGFAIGAAMITKSSGSFFLYLMPFSLLTRAKEKLSRGYVVKLAGLSLVTFVISQIIYNSLRLSPLFYIISRKNSEFIRPLSEVIKDPLATFSPNFITLAGWAIIYLGPLLFLTVIITICNGVLTKNFKIIYLTLLILIPFGAETVFNKVLYPRFMLFYFPYVIVIVAYFISEFWNRFKDKRITSAAIALAMIFPVINSFLIIFEPTKAEIPSSDAGQYLNDWPAGYGVKEVVSFLANQPIDKEIYMGTEGTFGLLPYALQVYFYGQKNIHITGFWPVDAHKLPEQILESAKNNPTYFVFNENQKEITNPHLKFINKYQKGIGNSYMRLYQVVPQ